MGRYIVKRILLAILTVFIICAITFFVMNAIPGGPFNREKALSAATIEALNKRYNLDKPVPEQFLLYMKNLLHGDFGVSLKNGRNITEIIAESFPISAKLGLMAIAVALLCGTVFGSFAALMRNKLPDRIIVFFSTLFTAVPSFVLATLLLLVFCIRLAWFPVWDPNQPNYLLPVIALSAYPMAYVTRLSKSSMLDALSQDYIRTAKAKGVAKWKVIFKHALRNSLLPVITYAGPQIAYIITGSMVIETIFTVGGIGSKFVSAITSESIGRSRGSASVVSSPSGAMTMHSLTACVSHAPSALAAQSSSPSTSNTAVSSAIIVTHPSPARLTALRLSRATAAARAFSFFSRPVSFCSGS